MVLDPSGTIMNSDLGEAFDGGVMVVGSGDLKTKLFGLPGHQNVLLSWSNKERTSLIQDPSNVARMLLTAKFPQLGDPGPVLEEILKVKAPGLLAPTQPLNKETETWAAVYSFEQYLWQPSQADPKRGVGMFFSAGVSDGRANPIRNSYSLGVVGKGVVPGRANDHFGIGWSRVAFSDNFVPQLALAHEDALELYYSAAITPWLTVSPSLQVIRPGPAQTLDANHNLKSLDTTYMVGVRMGIRF
jgi:porin